MSTVVVATARVAPEHRDVVRAAFESAVPRVHAEPGCELYALHEGADRFVLIERWTDDDALAVHAAAPALADLRAALAGRMVGELDIQVLRAIPAGAEQQGML